MLKHIKKLWLAFVAIMIWCNITQNHTLATWFWDTIGVSWIETIWTKQNQGNSLLHTIQTAINWILWILATITLCLVLYAGFLMLISWGDSKKYDQWVTIIKNAAIWLAIIAASWLIVSLIFYVINGSVNPNIQE